MIDLPANDELRETRRRLAEEHGNDVRRYAVMLAETASSQPSAYVVKPLVPQPAPMPVAAKASRTIPKALTRSAYQAHRQPERLTLAHTMQWEELAARS